MSNRLLDLPSLDLLRSFVAVGRRMSITLAAQDMCLTQSALSRQIQALESSLGYRLLVRGHRSIEFTGEGRRLFRSADAMLEQLGDVVASLRPADTRQPVTISASIGVTALWILPRLNAFQQAAPDIDVRVAASNRFVDMEREQVDLSLRYCRPQDAPTDALRLFDEAWVPVAHPALAVGAIEEAAQLRRQVLLEFDDVSRPWLQWAGWLRGAGAAKTKPKGVLRFNQYDQVVQAALAGQGGRQALAARFLQFRQAQRAHARLPQATTIPWASAAKHLAGLSLLPASSACAFQILTVTPPACACAPGKGLKARTLRASSGQALKVQLRFFLADLGGVGHAFFRLRHGPAGRASILFRPRRSCGRPARPACRAGCRWCRRRRWQALHQQHRAGVQAFFHFHDGDAGLGSPASIARWIGAAPRQRGSSEPWILMQGLMSRVLRGRIRP
jgi:LysR family glycine cleavage system transcriptional activator